MPWETSQVPKKSNDSWMIVYEDKGTVDSRSNPAGYLVNCSSSSKKEKIWRGKGFVLFL